MTYQSRSQTNCYQKCPPGYQSIYESGYQRQCPSPVQTMEESKSSFDIELLNTFIRESMYLRLNKSENEITEYQKDAETFLKVVEIAVQDGYFRLRTLRSAPYS